MRGLVLILMLTLNVGILTLIQYSRINKHHRKKSIGVLMILKKSLTRLTAATEGISDFTEGGTCLI